VKVDANVSEEHIVSIFRVEDESTLKMEAVCSSETMVSTYKYTRRTIQKTIIIDTIIGSALGLEPET
jgi:hypothetical protein